MNKKTLIKIFLVVLCFVLSGCNKNTNIDPSSINPNNEKNEVSTDTGALDKNDESNIDDKVLDENDESNIDDKVLDENDESNIDDKELNENNETDTYTEIVNKMEQILATKKYSDDAKKIIRDIVDTMYREYDAYYEVYQIFGVPDKKQYIYTTFLNPLEENVDTITILDDDFNHTTFEGNSIQGMYEEKKKEISLKSNAGYENMKRTIRHEIYHATQKGLKPMSGEYSFLWYIMGEGAAEDSQKGVEQTLYNSGGIFIEDPNKKDFEINFYGRSSNYCVYSNFYNKLLLLTDYSTVQQFALDGDVDKFINVFYDKYGIETTDEIFSRMRTIVNNLKIKDTVMAYNIKTIYIGEEIVTEREIDEDIVSSAIELENIVLNCMKQNIEELSSKIEVQQYFNFYRAYKYLYMIDYLERTLVNGIGITYDYTKTKINYDMVEECLIEKIAQYEALPKFSDNIAINNLAIKALIYNNKTHKATDDNMVLFFKKFSLCNQRYNFIESEEECILNLESEQYTFDNTGIYKWIDTPDWNQWQGIIMDY